MEDLDEKSLRVRVEHLFRNASAELARQQGVKIGHFVAGVEPAGDIGAVVIAAESQNVLPRNLEDMIDMPQHVVVSRLAA